MRHRFVPEVDNLEERLPLSEADDIDGIGPASLWFPPPDPLHEEGPQVEVIILEDLPPPDPFNDPFVEAPVPTHVDDPFEYPFADIIDSTPGYTNSDPD